MTRVVLLQVLLGHEEFGAVLALDDVLLLLRWQSKQVLIGPQGLLLYLELLFHGFELFHLGFKLVFQLFGLCVPLATLGIQNLVHALEIVLGVQQILNG